MRVRRRTLAGPVRLAGRGLHSGRPVQVVVHPGDNGIAFQHNGSRTVAAPDAVTGTDRHTTLGDIATVEHIMSALSGMEITDAEIELSYPELPALDGSAAGFVAVLGRTQSLEPTEIFLPDREIFVSDRDAWIRVRPGTGQWSYTYAYCGITQTFACKLPDDYLARIARARTIAPVHEVSALLARGLGQGLDIGSVVLVGPEGYGNEPRYPDEPARHKLLDLVGDLALSGIPARCLDVTAHLSGHTTGVRMARLIARHVSLR
ncbi:UDP-3-O-[3-hydroxymyristoyl] N-acetylglucosamine deacetylase [Kibdelosporangium banguiense]|uniref:UDP-3-O-acyl-N-acetylglucosamine deacetylase n=1 Tax=Kibdelosporangium banguiense TaxID=1365924 RepID=A0ABS4TPK1_9PSEU|nr:UDP-3-O-acyl-N-acetylglucosamine deacetylase [Kibdelosporangium banguiense]MBP2326326.1 UDP-3-O-[3-hydroxymyristoyl] N-acetylglucosamine deacetylase [Kibdelosporangium banguiense]